jgi:hypothetical protein
MSPRDISTELPGHWIESRSGTRAVIVREMDGNHRKACKGLAPHQRTASPFVRAWFALTEDRRTICVTRESLWRRWRRAGRPTGREGLDW